MIEGKTIVRVIGEDDPWIVFTDGTGIRTVGWDDGSDYAEVTAEDIAEHETVLAERAALAALRQAEQDSWMMRSCQERADIRTEWIAAQPKTLFPHGWDDLLTDDLIWDLNRQAYGGSAIQVKARCPHCNERACPNAPYMEPPNRGLFYEAGTILIPKA